ncbi:hypothetical protein BDR06DRAFT_1006852 [Suillus hirtellus]|nr:hypothetical protein BDR06DRAFT_1006852 [Suillus hirtellus]
MGTARIHNISRRTWGTYFMTTWNAVVLLGAILARVEDMAGARGYEDEEEIGRQRRQNGHHDFKNGDQRVGVIEETEPTEITPLIAQHGQPTPSGEEQSARLPSFQLFRCLLT